MKPYAHQIQTFRNLAEHRLWGVFDDPGCGKTRAVVCAAEALHLSGKTKRGLYVCPNKVRETAGREIGKWTGLSYTVLDGGSADRVDTLENTDTYFYVVNYESVRLIKNELAKKNFDLIICDESTRIKNLTSGQAKALAFVGKGSSTRWIVTGTPMPRDPFDLHGQFSFLGQGILGDLTSFRSEFVKYITRDGMPVPVGYKNEDKLRDIIAKFSSRHLKSECLDLPPKVHVECDVPMYPAQVKIYDQFTDELMAELPSGTVMPIRSAMSKYMRLQQVATGFVGREGGTLEWLGSSKLDYLLELLDSIHLHDNKVIIWCTYTPSVLAIQEALAEYNPAMFYGGVKNSDAEIRKFNEDDTCRVLIGNSKVGIGCTLNAAKYTVYFELPYFDTEALTQSQDRNHRIGQTADKVTYYYLLAPGTVDHTILKNLNGKFKLAAFITGDDARKIARGEE